MSIQQTAMIRADPAQAYAVLANAEAQSGLSGMSGVSGQSPGEEFSAFAATWWVGRSASFRVSR